MIERYLALSARPVLAESLPRVPDMNLRSLHQPMSKQQAKGLAAASWCDLSSKLYLGSDSRHSLTTPATASVFEVRIGTNPEAGT